MNLLQTTCDLCGREIIGEWLMIISPGKLIERETDAVCGKCEPQYFRRFTDTTTIQAYKVMIDPKPIPVCYELTYSTLRYGYPQNPVYKSTQMNNNAYDKALSHAVSEVYQQLSESQGERAIGEGKPR